MSDRVPDSPPSPSFCFHPSTRDFSYSRNKHVLSTYWVPESQQRLSPHAPIQREGQTQTHTPGFVLFRDRAPQTRVQIPALPGTSHVTQEDSPL